MQFEEIIQRLRERDNRVTHCFFFWEGPSLQRIEAIRRVDPARAAQLPKPICNSCRPGLLKVLHTIYGGKHFDYDELVTDFYCYLLNEDKLATINNPDALMGWIVTTAYYFFLKEKIKQDKLLENEGTESLSDVKVDIEEDESATNVREYVQEVLAAMPNRAYAKILDEVTLEVGQYKGQAKAEKMRELSTKMGIPIDNLYVKISLAKKQFKDTALKMQKRLL